jgi:uncharacterized protein involved in response to NO
LLQIGFRPFFLLAGVWAVFAMLVWIAMLSGDLPLPTVSSGPMWHAHEFVFGFALAVVAGFLLTAVPNWTGRAPITGAPLALLVLLWAAARIGFTFSAWLGPVISSTAVLLFPFALTVVITREIVAAGNWRNLAVVFGLALLLVADSLFQLSSEFDLLHTDIAMRLAVAVLVAMMSLIGGRVTPAFTRNWLNRKGSARLPAAADRYDLAAILLTVLALLLWVALPESMATGIGLLAAAASLAFRLSRWCGYLTWREPLLLILHIGYAWLPFGLVLLAWSLFSPTLAAADAQHGLTTGAIGTMTLAMMTRASLGHSGRPLSADHITVVIYCLILLAGVGRVIAGFASDHYTPLTQLSAALWIGAFSFFVAGYGSLFLTGGRDD